jgi:hypothetical protein
MLGDPYIGWREACEAYSRGEWPPPRRSIDYYPQQLLTDIIDAAKDLDRTVTQVCETLTGTWAKETTRSATYALAHFGALQLAQRPGAAPSIVRLTPLGAAWIEGRLERLSRHRPSTDA